jgi:hypothetical protein
MIDVQRRHEQVKKPICISHYNMFMKGVDRADQYLAYYSLLRKTVKWMKKVALWLINRALFNSFSVYKNLNPRTKLRYKEFLLRVAKAWSTEPMEAAQAESDTDLVRPGLSTPTPCRPHVDPPGQLLGDMWKHVLAQIVKSEKGKRKYPARPCRVCTVHKKRSETAYICEFCVVPLHKGKCFQRYHTHALLGALVSFY